MKKLTNKMETYCQQRTNGLNQADAYLIAYPISNNWSKSTLYARSSELEKKPQIQQRIKKLQKPLQNLLEKHRTKIIKKCIDLALSDKEINNSNIKALLKLLDKLVPNKTADASEPAHNFNIFFDLIKEHKDKRVS